MHPTVMGSHAAQSCSRTVGRAEENSAPPSITSACTAVLLDGASEKPRQRAQVVSAENHIEMGKRRKQLVAVALADAAAYGDVALVEGRAVAQGDVLHGGDLPVEPRVGSLADAARHEHDDVRLLDGFDRQRAQALQHAGDPLGIVLVHLAAEGVDAET